MMNRRELLKSAGLTLAASKCKAMPQGEVRRGLVEDLPGSDLRGVQSAVLPFIR